MKIDTKFFGTIEAPEQAKVYFPQALYGFEKLHDYVLLPFDLDNDSLICMQSLDDAATAFILINPFEVMAGYIPKVLQEDLETVKAAPDEGVLFYAVTVVKENGDITVNLRSPVIVNPRSCLAKQAMLEDSRYSMRHPVYMGQEG